jgi:hypothetical protein
MRTTFLASCALGALTLAALTLAACQNPNNANTTQASADAAAPLAPPVAAESAPAPAGAALPSAPPARVNYAAPARRYHYLDEADSMSQAYADAPPDYAFDYDGQAPQAWGSGQGVVRVGERVPGGWRYYYYQPGADTPYLVRDPDYAYGYDNGELVVVYDSHGRQLDQAYADRQAGIAGRYWARARALREAALRNQRHEVADQVWRDQAAEQARQRAEWDRTRQQDADWRAYHDQNARQDQGRWGAVAAAWAAAQALAPHGGGDQGRGDQGRDVDAQRQAWRARYQGQGQGQGGGQAPQYAPQGPAAQAPGRPPAPGPNGYGDRRGGPDRGPQGAPAPGAYPDRAQNGPGDHRGAAAPQAPTPQPNQGLNGHGDQGGRDHRGAPSPQGPAPQPGQGPNGRGDQGGRAPRFAPAAQGPAPQQPPHPAPQRAEPIVQPRQAPQAPTRPTAPAPAPRPQPAPPAPPHPDKPRFGGPAQPPKTESDHKPKPQA